jgi:Carboxypeptidase regulatory-like domain
MLTSLSRVLLASCATFLLCSIVASQPTTGELTGTVTGTDGTPKSFAHVQLQGSAIYAAVTDINGKFTVNQFATGATYRITVRQDDNTETQTLKVTGWTLSVIVHW